MFLDSDWPSETSTANTSPEERRKSYFSPNFPKNTENKLTVPGLASSRANSRRGSSSLLRSTNVVKQTRAKQKVIQMLFIVVVEFFICWSPLHVVHTWYLYDPEGVSAYVGPLGFGMIHLLAFLSACVNPITYGFMYRKFRAAFLQRMKCLKLCHCCLEPEESASPAVIVTYNCVSMNDLSKTYISTRKNSNAMCNHTVV